MQIQRRVHTHTVNRCSWTQQHTRRLPALKRITPPALSHPLPHSVCERVHVGGLGGYIKKPSLLTSPPPHPTSWPPPTPPPPQPLHECVYVCKRERQDVLAIEGLPIPRRGDLLSHRAPVTHVCPHTYTQTPGISCSGGEQHPSTMFGKRMMKEPLASWNVAENTHTNTHM